MIGSLQSLRFIFAIFIFLHHLSLFELGGTCGVSFFFILSGFVMMKNYGEEVLLSSFSYYHYIKKRIIRIYPLHLLCLFTFILINYKSITPIYLGKLFPNMLLLQSWIPQRNYYFSGNALSWSLSCLVFFYACFPLMVNVVRKLNFKSKFVLALSIVTLYIVALISIPEDLSHAFFYINPIFRLLDFAIGMSTYKVYKAISKRSSEKSYSNATLMEFGALLFLFVSLLLGLVVPDRILYSVLYWLPISLLILTFAYTNSHFGLISKILNNKILIILSEGSFVLYIIHQLSFTILDKVRNELQIEIGVGHKALLYFIILTLASMLIAKYIERPTSSYLKKRLLV